MATKQQTQRTSKAARSRSGKPTERTKTFTRRYAKTIDDNISHIRMNIMAVMPGILDTDKNTRKIIIHYLCDQHPDEVKAAQLT